MRTFNQNGAVSIWSAFRSAGCRLLRRTKKGTRIASLMSIAAAALCASQSIQAAQVIATITGTLQGGSIDHSGVFGFAKETNISGQNFTVVYTIDDTKGTKYAKPNNNGVSYSCIENYSDQNCGIVSNTSNPITAVITINGHSYSFGRGTAVQSSARRVYLTYATSGADQFYFYLYDSYGQYVNDYIENEIISTSTFTTDYNWESPLSYAGPLTTSITSFNINRGTTLSASGNLIANSIIISGIESPACYLAISSASITVTPSNHTMFAAFTPQGSIATAATACGVVGFNWQQYINVLPSPSPFYAVGNTKTPLTAPPPFLDPPLGGYTYDSTDDPYPFYLMPAEVNDSLNKSNGHTLDFSDAPRDALLPNGKVIQFTTELVGVLPGNVPGDIYFWWTWITTYNGQTGGVSIQNMQAQP